MPAEGQLGSKKNHFRPMTLGPEHVDMGTPYFPHTFQRWSNRAPAIILERSTDCDENLLKGKSFMPPDSIEPMVTANDSKPQSETSGYQ